MIDKSNNIRIGIIGTGMISNVIASAINQANQATLVAVSSRSLKNAQTFADTHHIPHTFDQWETLVQWDGIDAAYIGTPTIAKEAIAITAAENGKHILVDKPFIDVASVKRITAVCTENNVAFMDATHFTHHPRTALLQKTISSQIGNPQAINSTFFFPFLDRDNIRYNPAAEPTGAIGDMTWYSLRGIVEYMPEAKEIESLKTFVQRDPQTNAIFRAAGLIEFKGGMTSTWNIGYNAGVCRMDLDILGESGSIQLDDFVLDWNSGFAFDNPDHQVIYTLRTGMASPQEFQHLPVGNTQPQTVHMINHFAQLIQEDNQEAIKNSIQKTEKTQTFLDAVWDSITQ
ncbi:Gfo/Idh/MocA family oxidoreductase [Algivirga pacifica]|uniref:Gfo/Idh/MocA-like oxidoreductase N-terminal domain-containing protein n=1 Tax=Algivirga pacifica TaxID=1162670 RepID=A0ABP9DNW5_9BACT